MRKFREFAKAKLVEALDHDQLGNLIHAINQETATRILTGLGIAGRKGLTLTNVNKFKHLLLAAVGQRDPKMNAAILAAGPKDFKPIIQFWKSYSPQADPSVPSLDGGAGVDAEPEPQRAAPQPTPSSQIKDGKMNMFPPVGSRLSERLFWVMQLERDTNDNMIGHVVQFLAARNYQPTTVDLRDDQTQLVKQYIADPRDMFGTDVEKARRMYDLYRRGLLNDIGNGKMQPVVLESIIDYLARHRVVRLRGDELEYIAKWHLSKWTPNYRPAMSRQLAERMVADFGDQAYHGE